MNALVFYRHFPVAIGRYLHWALQNLGYNVLSAGTYSDGRIPWGDQYYYPDYKMPPNIQTPDGNVSYESIKPAMKKLGFKPDIVFQCADVCHLVGKTEVPNVVIGTDPHAIDYRPARMFADAYFSMQDTYKDGGYWLPYGYDKDMIKYESPTSSFGVTFCGLQYSHRLDALKRLETICPVSIHMGLIYDDYVDVYRKSLVAFNMSSKNDLPARFWEGLAMGNLVITNNVPDLDLIEAKDGVHYLRYSTTDELVEKVKWARDNPTKAHKIAVKGGRWVFPHTYTEHLAATIKQWNPKYLP